MVTWKGKSSHVTSGPVPPHYFISVLSLHCPLCLSRPVLAHDSHTQFLYACSLGKAAEDFMKSKMTPRSWRHLQAPRVAGHKGNYTVYYGGNAGLQKPTVPRPVYEHSRYSTGWTNDIKQYNRYRGLHILKIMATSVGGDQWAISYSLYQFL